MVTGRLTPAEARPAGARGAGRRTLSRQALLLEPLPRLLHILPGLPGLEAGAARNLRIPVAEVDAIGEPIPVRPVGRAALVLGEAFEVLILGRGDVERVEPVRERRLVLPATPVVRRLHQGVVAVREAPRLEGHVAPSEPEVGHTEAPRAVC